MRHALRNEVSTSSHFTRALLITLGLAIVMAGSVTAQQISWDVRRDATLDPATSYAPADGTPDHGRHAIATDAAGNTYIAGRARNGSNYDLFTVSYDPAGVKRWEAHENGSAGSDDWAYAVAIAGGSGNVIVTGASAGASGNLQCLTIAYSSNGIRLWAATKAVPGGDAVAYAVAVHSSGDIYVAGYAFNGTDNDFLTIAYGADGVERWSSLKDGTGHGDDRAVDVAVDESENIYATGASWNGSDLDYLTVSYDASGANRWAKTMNAGDDSPAAMTVFGGRVFVTGSSRDASGVRTCVTVSYGSAGEDGWQATRSSSGAGDTAGNALSTDAATNRLYITGYATNASGNRDLLTIAYACANGAQAWAVLKDVAGASDTGYALVVDPNGTVFVTGVSEAGGEAHYLTLAYQPTGSEIWTHTLADHSANDRSYAVAARPGAGAVITGFTNDLGAPSIRAVAFTFAAPTITAGDPVSVVVGGFPRNAQVATVHDDFDPPTSLAVTATSIPAGITFLFSSQTEASIDANCSAQVGPNIVVLQVSNRGGVKATANFTVNAAANQPPILGTYPNQSILTAASAAYQPSMEPYDDGVYNDGWFHHPFVAASASPQFTGQLIVARSTGTVSVKDARPQGLYTVTVTATDNCGLTASRSFQLTVAGVTAPQNVAATAKSTSEVLVTWTPVPDAVGYDLFRGSTLVASTPATTWTDKGLAPNKAYIYRAYAFDAAGVRSASSVPDLAMTYLLDTYRVEPGMEVRASHFEQARIAVNILRVEAGLAPFAYVEAPPPVNAPYAFSYSTLGGRPILAHHVWELRQAIRDARYILGLPQTCGAWIQDQRSNPPKGTPILAVHLMEILDGVR